MLRVETPLRQDRRDSHSTQHMLYRLKCSLFSDFVSSAQRANNNNGDKMPSIAK